MIFEEEKKNYISITCGLDVTDCLIFVAGSVVIPNLAALAFFLSSSRSMPNFLFLNSNLYKSKYVRKIFIIILYTVPE